MHWNKHQYGTTGTITYTIVAATKVHNFPELSYYLTLILFTTSFRVCITSYQNWCDGVKWHDRIKWQDGIIMAGRDTMAGRDNVSHFTRTYIDK